MKKKILLIFLFLPLLSACGEEEAVITETQETEATPSQVIDPNATRFQIGETIYSVTIPPSWVKMPPPQDSDGVLLAYHHYQNFSIIRGQADTSEPHQLIQGLINNAHKSFVFFDKLNADSETTWSFQGKIESLDPLRKYQQKFYPIPGTSFFLIGSCANEVARVSEDPCASIIKSWKMLEAPSGIEPE